MWHPLQAADKVKDALSGSGGGGEVRNSATSCLDCAPCCNVIFSVCLGMLVASLLKLACAWKLVVSSVVS